jgi:hypothetical protein
MSIFIPTNTATQSESAQQTGFRRVTAVEEEVEKYLKKFNAKKGAPAKPAKSTPE